MTPGEIWLARFPLAGSGGSKLRPVLLLSNLTGPVPEILTGYISSVIPSPLLPSDLVLDPSRPEFAQTSRQPPSCDSTNWRLSIEGTSSDSWVCCHRRQRLKCKLGFVHS